MAEVYLAKRRAFLLSTQNPDGGWGYFPGKASWLEPTAYAMLALDRGGPSSDARRRAWRLLEQWQLPDGSWRAGSQVPEGTWVTSLAVTLCAVEREPRPALASMLARGVHHLLLTSGAERSTTFRLMEFFGLAQIGQDATHPGWPWRHGTSSWIEPTAHTLVALKKSRKRLRDRRIAWRIHEGEQMVLARRCADGGWNHGAPGTFHIAAPSYPESTALALLALQGCGRHNTGSALDMAHAQRTASGSALARAWLSIALQTWGETVPPPGDSGPIRGDIMLIALEALAHPSGNHRLLRTGEAS